MMMMAIRGRRGEMSLVMMVAIRVEWWRGWGWPVVVMVMPPIVIMSIFIMILVVSPIMFISIMMVVVMVASFTLMTTSVSSNHWSILSHPIIVTMMVFPAMMAVSSLYNKVKYERSEEDPHTALLLAAAALASSSTSLLGLSLSNYSNNRRRVDNLVIV